MWATLAVLLLLVQSSDHAAEGLKALGSGEYETAAEAFRKAVAADPSDYSAHFNLALAYGFLARDEDGIAEYRRTLELKPGLYQAELNCGMLLLRRKDPGAVALLGAAAAQKPDELRPRHRTGRQIRRRRIRPGPGADARGQTRRCGAALPAGGRARPQVCELAAGAGRRLRKGAPACR